VFKGCAEHSSLALVRLKGIFVGVVACVGHLLCMFDLVDEDIFAFLGGDLDVDDGAALHADAVLIHRVLAGTRVVVLLLFEGRTESGSFSLVLFEGVLDVVVACFG